MKHGEVSRLSQDPTTSEQLNVVQNDYSMLGGGIGHREAAGMRGRHRLSRDIKAGKGPVMKVRTHHKRNLQAAKQPLKGFEFVVVGAGVNSKNHIS